MDKRINEKYQDKLFWILHDEDGDEYSHGICENKGISWSIDLLWYFNDKIYPEKLANNRNFYDDIVKPYINNDFIENGFNYCI